MKTKLASAVIVAAQLIIAVSLCRSQVKTGDEIFVEKYLSLIQGKRVGIITNQSGVLPNGKHIVDVLANTPGVNVVALFSPEHGIRGNASDGALVGDSFDKDTGIPVHSLYGRTVKPTSEMLKGIDVLIYDIQDVGVRFYTFISTLDLTMEAAAENHVKYIVLDRPDMERADLVDGPVLDDSLRSFVGIQPIPSLYGMTPGEFATMLNDEFMLKDSAKTDLTVIKMENYKRAMWFDESGLKWITPSPNLRNLEAVEIYPGDVLIEGTNVSEGRGTDNPFENVGAPYIDSKKLVALLDSVNLAGVKFEPIDFTPQSLPWALEPKYDSVLCHGVKITVIDRNEFKPVECGVTLIWALHKLFPDEFKFRDAGFDRLSGERDVRLDILEGKNPQEIFSRWDAGLKKFERVREKYLLY